MVHQKYQWERGILPVVNFFVMRSSQNKSVSWNWVALTVMYKGDVMHNSSRLKIYRLLSIKVRVKL